ncbi:RagB/SusD family nutrient uptake outer membrane protein [Chitinophaga parva]|uniref:RagB/SusD family nutrient uptake outer membrane protein n=1 Tax=Chitinophaga parva TaxID=2169414 RepID=A0A2T7BLQ1_9BACT|nr:RagB/SusD family nutrient uptake outer membrane protein [Chitinophaga parva]PUZ28551.1 RagB/SusD family nutrient uptake outer membrane protein [Chitinophaga parva]
MKKQVVNNIIMALLLPAMLLSCKKFLQVGAPKTGLVDASVFASKSTAMAAVTGLYADMQGNYSFASGGPESIGHVCGLSSDELVNYSQSLDYAGLYQNTVTPLNGTPAGSTWNNPYYYIYQCNDIIAGVTTSSTIADEDKKEVIGQAEFIRAFCYFYLTNLYGDIPLNLTTDYSSNRNSSKASSDKVYEQIIVDLQEAADNLPAPGPTDTRILPNSDVATAMLARVYLYLAKYPEAIAAADKIIANTARYQLLPDLSTVFLKESREAIWQLQPVIPGQNTNEGVDFILTAAPTNAVLSDRLLDAFEPADTRKTFWVGNITVDGTTYYFPYKYKVLSSSDLTEYSMVIRLAELYLIRAEAKAMTANLAGAMADLNMIRHRAGLGNTTSSTQASLLLAIEHERQVELFTEWGHRWLDLKRTGRATAVLSPLKPSWKPTAVLFPIPQSEINANPHITQNQGY